MNIKSVFGAGRIEDKQDDGDDNNSKAAEDHHLLVGVLLVLVGLEEIFLTQFEVPVGLLHFLETNLNFNSLLVDHNSGLIGDILNLVDQPLDLY